MDVDTPLRAHPGTDWLANLSPSPDGIRQSWARGRLAGLCVPAGGLWTVGEIGLIRCMLGIESLGRSGMLGPVLTCPSEDLAWILLPGDADRHLSDISDLYLLGAGECLLAPPVDRPMSGRAWIELPDGTGRLTDPSALGAVLGRTHRLRQEHL